MKNIIYILPLFIFFSCGGGNDSAELDNEADSLFSENNEWVLSAKKLKKKLGALQQCFFDIGNKEVEETICLDNSTIYYTGNEKEMNIYLMSTYILDNFSDSTFGKHNFEMPKAMIRNVTPLAELNWMNINSLDTQMFNIYKQYPDLTNIPKFTKDDNGQSISNLELLKKTDKVYKALEDGLLCIVVITDYLPPTFAEDGKYETGYVMGYVLFADWENEQLSCISPFLAQNSTVINFENTVSETVDNADSKEVQLMKADLQSQTFIAIDSIARARTRFKGEVWVNNAAHLERFKN